MLRQMERSTIQLLHKRGTSQREIARALGHSRTTVARALTEPVDRQPATTATAVPRRPLPGPDRAVGPRRTEWRTDAGIGARRPGAALPWWARRLPRGGAPRATGPGAGARGGRCAGALRGLAGRVPPGGLGRDPALPFTQRVTQRPPSPISARGTAPRRATFWPAGSSTAAGPGCASPRTCARRRSSVGWWTASVRWGGCRGCSPSTT